MRNVEVERLLPSEVEIDHDLDHVPGCPWIESDVDDDDGTYHVGWQHDDDDTVDILDRGDPFGLAQQHRHALHRRDLRRLATIVELRGLDEDPLIVAVERIGRRVLERLVRRHRRPADPFRTGAPHHPAWAEFRTGIPGP